MIKILEDVSQTEIYVVEEALQVEQPTRKRVGIMGGTFNPPHIGHLIIAQQAGMQLGLDEVRFMPSASPPHVDTKKSIEGDHRLEMVQRAVEDNPLFRVEKAEIERGGVSYTIDTMKQLTAENPDTDYYFIIGGDMVAYLPKWERIDELMQLVHFVGVARPGYPVTSEYPIIWVDVPEIDVSSTIIRKMVQQGRCVKYLVPDAVAAYISEAGLYTEDETDEV